MDYSCAELYINLLLLAMAHNRDFAAAVQEAGEYAQKRAPESNEGTFVPKGFDGICFVDRLAKLVGSSLVEAYTLEESRKEEILQELLSHFDSVADSYAEGFEITDNLIEFKGLLDILNTTDDRQLREYFRNSFKGDSIYSEYPITFQKILGSDPDPYYKIEISVSKEMESAYAYDSYVVWNGSEGPLADYIDDVIENYKPEEEEEIETIPASKPAKTDSTGTPMYVEKPIIESKEPKGPGVQEELVRSVVENTKTVDLLDEFEGIADKTKHYRRIVIRNTKYRDHGKGVGYNLVIERGKGNNHVGGVTFTDFKKDRCSGLIRHIRAEVTDDVIKRYKDGDHFYRFSKPYLLRAQNSQNRTGYGWEWKWSGGYGDYTEGTLYGETTNYFFVGVYITSGYYGYDPKNRRRMMSTTEEGVKGSSAPAQRYRVVPFDGKLKNTTSNPVESSYLEVTSPSGKKKKIQAFFDKETGKVYVARNEYRRYQNWHEGIGFHG